MAAHECGLAGLLQLVRVDVATLRPHAQVISHNPLGKIPTLVLEDGSAYFDSSVICEWFHCQNPDAGLFPDDGIARLIALRRQALGNGLMDILVIGRAEALRPDGTRSDAHVSTYRRKRWDVLAALEAEAGSIAADAFSIGHITIGCALSYLDFRYADEDWRAEAPHLAAWHKTFCLRPSAEQTAFADNY
ncbi:glutathione S-transferase N-terminal domain-containing protein [Acidisoma cellulosilytica]|uniref:Glutathione S-transferase N-terminal domain-containing protein n=2 Tax=Acidisoma cellulosilyticum TaxID=2802395 RepID=A0A963Z569_9PROT|nr:glutathione S-transferase N-terminal domain-containing protein [Acidisoma cellulosilyticum]